MALQLKEWYLAGKFTPYFETDPEALYGVIQHFMQSVKPYQRVERIIRDVPASQVRAPHNMDYPPKRWP